MLGAVPQIELRPIDELVAYARNARTHSPEQVEQIKASMLEFGWTNSVLADGQGIVAGHGRVMAARSLYGSGRTLKFPNGSEIPLGMVPVVDCSGWSSAQRRAYILADNKLALNAGWDTELLRIEFEELKAEDFDLALAGWGGDELAELFGEVDLDARPAVDPDDAPDVPETPVSVLGDVWVMGDHKVMCGSALEARDWVALMGDESADVVFTDPPYNVAIGDKLTSVNNALGRRTRFKKTNILNDSMSDDAFYAFLLKTFECLKEVMKPGASIYVYHSDSEGVNFRMAFRDAGFKQQSCLIWRKNTFVLSRWDHQPVHENCLYGWLGGAGHKWHGGRKQTTFVDLVADASPFQRQEDGSWAVVWGDEVFVVAGDARVDVVPSAIFSEPKPARSDLHPTMKPVQLVRRHLRNSAVRGDLVVDAFGGAGSTMLAAHQEAMRSRLMELDPKYVDVIVRRMWAFSGIRPVHAVTGEPFPVAGESRNIIEAVDCF